LSGKLSRDIVIKGSELTTSYEGERGKEKKEKTHTDMTILQH